MPARPLADAPHAAECGVARMREQVCRIASAFDARRLERDVAVALLREWTAIAYAAEAAAALAAARIDECGPPPSAGARDTSEFVAKTTGTTSARARERIQTGARLTNNDKTRAKAAAGALSPEQTAALTDALAVDPSVEEALLAAAERGSLGELRDRCAETKAAVVDMAERERSIHARRCVRRYRDREGAEHLHATGTKRDMALIDQALKAFVDQRFKRARADGVREPLDAYTFDALVDMATNSLDGGARHNPRRNDPIRHLGVLRIDLQALVRGHTDSGETCEIAGLGPISVQTARELLGESVLKLVITKGVDVVNVTHLGRGPNTAQKIAMLWQQPVCSREGCNRHCFLEYDHRDGKEYRKTKHTRLDETDPLCRPDHDLKTYFGWALVEGRGKRPLVPPDDRRHPNHRRPP